jgi:hypothetical protein
MSPFEYHFLPMSKRCEECGTVAKNEALRCESCGGSSWLTVESGSLQSLKVMSLIAGAIAVVVVMVWLFWGR